MKVNFSLIITCFEKERYLPDLLDSISNQTRKPAEVFLIHDDCSEASATYEGITTIFQRPNKGVANARDLGFKLSKCPVVVFLDGDDVIAPDYLEKAAYKLVKGFDAVYSDVLLWYEHGSIDYGVENVLQMMDKVTPKKMMQHNRLLVSCPMKREVYKKVGGFREMPVFEDYDFWMRAMALGFKFGKFDSLFWYRQAHGTRNRQDRNLRQEAYKKITDRYEIIKGKLKEKK